MEVQLKEKIKNWMPIAGRLLGAVALSATYVFAGGVQMPWNSGLNSLSGNLTGVTALGVTTAGAAGTFLPMVFHGEMPQWASTSSRVALVGGTLLGIPSLVSYLGIGGSLI
jgi:type IV secretory pathway VirB2 component (pilin)